MLATRKSVLLVTLLVVPTYGLADDSPHEAVSVRRTARISSVTFCRTDDAFSVARVRVSITTENTGTTPVIIHRALRSDTVTTRDVGSKKQHTVTGDRFDQSAENFDVYAPTFEGSPNANAEFVVLAPGSSWTSDVLVPVPVERQRDIEAAFTVTFWPYSHETADRLRSRWHSYGRLITTDFVTKPLKVSLRPEGQLAVCQ